MSTPAKDERPIGLAQIAADDLLLDALGRGAPPPASDPAVSMLAAWRADLDTDLAAEPVETEPAGTEPVVAAPRDRRRQRRLTRMVIGAAPAAVVAAGLAVSAHQAEPGSPLWPVARVVYPERAEVLAAEKALGDARTAVAAGRADDARRLLDVASAHVARIDDPAVAQRLRADIDAVRRALAAVAPDAPANPVPPAPSAQPTAPTPATSTPPAGGGAPTPGRSSAPPGLLPDLPLPALPLPTPLLPLPPLLPTQ